ncbi:hypothetical protein ACSBR1_027308 [Camellia fascicularis]
MPRASKRKSKPLKSSKVDGVRSASNKATMKKGEPIDDHFHSYANRSLGMIEWIGVQEIDVTLLTQANFVCVLVQSGRNRGTLFNLGVDHTDVRILMLAWKMNARKQGYFTQDESQRGLKALTVDTVNKLKNALSEDFYSFAFQYCLTEDKQKWIDVECICELLDIVMGSQFPSQVALFTKYLKIQNDYKVINMDQWTSFLRFCSQISFPDLKNYDAIEAWPLILDDFVECMREEKLATAES